MDILQFIMDEKEQFVPIEPTPEEKHIQYLKMKRLKNGDRALKKKYPWMDNLKEFNQRTDDERRKHQHSR